MRLPRYWNYYLKAFSFSQINLYFEIVLLHKMSYKLLIFSFVPHRSITTNGPAIWGGCVTRRKHRVGSWYPAPAGPESCHGARRVRRSFCRQGTNFIEHYACRGTSLIGAGKLSRYRILIGGTGAVSRYKLSRSQKFVKVQDLYCVQMRVSGFKNHYKAV
jgi:hypothetical protein